MLTVPPRRHPPPSRAQPPAARSRSVVNADSDLPSVGIFAHSSVVMTHRSLPTVEGQGDVLPALHVAPPASFSSASPVLAAGVIIQQAAAPTFITDESLSLHGLSKAIFRRLCRAGLPHRVVGGIRVALLDDARSWLKSAPIPAPTPKTIDPIGAKLQAAGLQKGGRAARSDRLPAALKPALLGGAR